MGGVVLEEKIDSKSKDLEKEKSQRKEIAKLKKIFKNLDENKQKVAQKLIESAAFLAVELKELEDAISVEGVVEEYQNGQYQCGFKKSSKVEVYNAFIKNYTSVIKQLCDMVPSEDGFGSNQAAGNELLKLVTMPKPIKK